MKVFEINPFRLPMNKVLPPQETPVGIGSKIRVILPGYNQLPAEEICDDVLLFPERSAVSRSRRLVVMIPRGNISENALARRIWQLASTSGLGVIYLALSPDEEQVPYYRRRLADLAMMTSNYNLRAYTHISSEGNWASVVNKIMQPGDVLVCMANHMVSHNLFQREKLGEELVQMNNVPVYMLGGIKIGQTPEWEFAFKEVAAWISSLLLIISFFGIQIGIDRSASGSFSKFLIGLSIMAETALLFKINDWIR